MPGLLQFMDDIRRNPFVQVIHIDEQTWEEGWTRLNRMDDKEWSLVDATSFIVMERQALTEAFTTDKHFLQADFTRVP